VTRNTLAVVDAPDEADWCGCRLQHAGAWQRCLAGPRARPDGRIAGWFTNLRFADFHRKTAGLTSPLWATVGRKEPGFGIETKIMLNFLRVGI